MEKENLDALKRNKGKKRENPDGSLQEEFSTSTPLILKRSLGVLTEEFGSREEVRHTTVDTGINTDISDAFVYDHGSNTFDCDTPRHVSNTCQVDFNTCPGEKKKDTDFTELITINETMSESLVIQHIFKPEDTLPFQIVAPTVTQKRTYIDQGTEMEVSNADINSVVKSMIDESKRNESPIITYNFNYVSSKESVETCSSEQNAVIFPTNHDIETCSIGVGTDFDDNTQHVNIDERLFSNYPENPIACNQLHEVLTETLPENIVEKTTLNHIRTKDVTTSPGKVIQTNETESIFSIQDSSVNTTRDIPRDTKTYSNASTQFEILNTNEVDESSVAASCCDIASSTLDKQDVYNVTDTNTNNMQINSPNEPNIVCDNAKDNLPLKVQRDNIQEFQCDISEINVCNNDKLEENISCLKETENHLCNGKELIMKDMSSSTYYSEEHLQNGKIYDDVEEKSPSIERYEFHLCNGKTNDDTTDNIPCLKESEKYLSIRKTEEDIGDMQSLELFEKNLSDDNREQGIVENIPSNMPGSKANGDVMKDIDCLEIQPEEHLQADKSLGGSPCLERSEKYFCNGKPDEAIIEDMQCNAIKSDLTTLLVLEEQLENVVNIIDVNIVENMKSTENNYDAIDSSINDKQSEKDSRKDVYCNSIVDNDTIKMVTSIEPSEKELCDNAKDDTVSIIDDLKNGSTNSDVLVNQNEEKIGINGDTNSDVLLNQIENNIYLNVSDEIACNIHIDNIENDIIVQEELKEQFVDQLCSYIWENMDFDTSVHGNDDIKNDNMTQVHDCIIEIKVDDITEREDIDIENIKEVECDVEINEQKSDLCHKEKSHMITGDVEMPVVNFTKKKDIDFADLNENDITEIHINDIMIKFNNNKDNSNKKEMCVQTDESCISSNPHVSPRYSNGHNEVPNGSFYKGGYLPPESDEERERFMNRFCYSASQNLAADADFQYREAKYVTNTEPDELYQGCLVYLNDTDSVSDYSEISEDSSLFSDFTKCDVDSDETLQAKLLMENIKNKYELLLQDFDLVSSERSRLQGESTRKRSCYDLLTNFKSALEEELSKLGEHSGRSSQSDSNESRSCFSPLQNLDQPSRLSRDISKQASLIGIQELVKPGKRTPMYSHDIDLLQLERTSPDGAQQKTPIKNLDTVMESFDENNNIKTVMNFNDGQNASLCVSENDAQKEISKSNNPQTEYNSFGASHSPITYTSSVSLEGTVDVSTRNKTPLCYRSTSLQENANVTNCGLATTEHEKLKRELMLTKLEKSRLEAVLSCVLLTNDIDIDNESNLKNLTMSRSTLSSSTSMAQLAKCSRTSSPFQVRSLFIRVYIHLG